MESTNDNNQMLFVSEFKELREELSTMKKRIVQLEKSHEKQQERLDILERENHALKKKTELNNLNGNKAVKSVLKRKRTEKDQDQEKDTESNSTPASASDGKKTKKNNNDDNEAVVISRCDNGDSFDSLSDDLLHKIVEFDGNCYAKFGSINKRCKNIYDVKEYKLKKQTCVFGYGTIDMMLEHYLKKRSGNELVFDAEENVAKAVIIYNRLDAIDWIFHLGDIGLLERICWYAGEYGRINILSKVFCKCNLKMLDELLIDDTSTCEGAAKFGQLETLKWLRKYGAKLESHILDAARYSGHDNIVQYLRSEGCPEFNSHSEDGDY